MPKTDGANLAYANMLKDVQNNELKILEFWSKTLEKMIVLERSNFVFTTLAKKISMPRKQGTKTWTVRRYLHLPVNLAKGQLSEGLAPVPMKVEGKKVSATIKQYGAYIEETDVSADIHFDNIMTIYQPELARHAAETIERDLLAALAAESSVRFMGSATEEDDIELTDVLTFAEIRRAWLRMRNYHREGHPSFGGAPVLVAHINVIQDLIDDEDLKEYIIVPGYDETPIRNGSLTQFKIYGINFVETKVLDPEANSSGVNVYTSYLLGRDGYALLDLGGSGVSWHQKGFKADSGDPLAQRATLGYKLWTGAKVLDPMAIVAIKGASAYDVGVIADLTFDEDARPAAQVYVAGAHLSYMGTPTKVSYDVSDDGAGGFEPDGITVLAKDSYGNYREVALEDVTFGNLVAGQTSVTMAATVEGVALTGTVTGLTIVA
jgi:N4-gp56 family major capsid protein